MLKVMDREGPSSEPQLAPAPLGAADWDLSWAAGWLSGNRKKKKVAVRIKHEQPDRCGMLAIRHSLQQLGEATCARPAGLSGIGIDTVDCTEVESELQMGKERGKGSQSMWSERLQYEATERWSVLFWFGPKIMLGYLSFQCDFWALILKITAYDSKWL